jgi:hypothetical protein
MASCEEFPYIVNMDGGHIFNIYNVAQRLLCPACGFPDHASAPAYDETGGIIGSAICPCCLWELGFDDDRSASKQARDTILDSIRKYREKWDGAAHWAGKPKNMPTNWDRRLQLNQLFGLATHVE